MADRELAIQVRAILGNFTGEFSKAESSVKKFGKTVKEEAEAVKTASKEMSEAWRGIGEAFLAFGVAEVFKKIAESASEAAGQIDIIANTTRNLRGVSASADDIEEGLKKLANSAAGGGFSMEELRDSTEAFASVGATGAQQMRLTADAAGLAATKNISLEHATRAITQAANGHVLALSRLVPGLHDASGKAVDFSTAMEKVEGAISGNAAIRAEEFAGALGRLGTAGEAVMESAFGRTIATVMTSIVNAMTRITQAISQMNPKFLEIAAVASLVGAAVLAVIGLFSAFTLVAAAVVSAVTTIIDTIAAAGLAFAAVNVEIWPVIAIVGAVGLAFGALALYVSQHMKEVMAAVDKAVAFVLNRLGQMESAIGSVFEAMGKALSHFGVGLGGTVAAAGKWAENLGAGMQRAKTPIEDLGKAAEATWAKMKGFFGSTAGGFTPGKTDWSGIGGQPKAGGDGQKELNDALTLAKEKIEAIVAGYVEMTEHAKAVADLASEAVSLYDKQLSLIAEADRTDADYLEKERLLGIEAQKQADVAKAINAQKQANLWAAQQETRLAASISSADKDRVAHQKELLDAAHKHTLEAQKLSIEYAKVANSIAGIKVDIAATIQAQERWAEDLAISQGEAGLDTGESVAKAQLQGQLQGVRGQADIAKLNPKTADNEKLTTGFAQQEAQLEYEMAQLALGFAQAKLQLLNEQAQEGDDKDAERSAAYQAVLRAQNELAASENTLNAAIVAHMNALNVINPALLQMKDAISQFINKLKVPGLDAKTNQQTGQIAISFNPWELLLQVIEKTKSFGDIIRVVTEIVKVLAEIFDGVFRPVIDAVLHALIFFVNVIISIVDIFGLHIAKLSQNFDDLNDAVEPLITVYRNMPSLNDLAKGNTGNLGTKSTGNSLGDIAGVFSNVAKNPVIVSAAAVVAQTVGSLGAAVAGPSAKVGNAVAGATSIVVNIGNVQLPSGQSAHQMGQALAEQVIQRMRNTSSTLDRVPAR